jgi:hypothetical protein
MPGSYNSLKRYSRSTRLGAINSQIDMTRIYLMRAVEIAGQAGREAIYAFAEGDEQRLMLVGPGRVV